MFFEDNSYIGNCVVLMMSSDMEINICGCGVCLGVVRDVSGGLNYIGRNIFILGNMYVLSFWMVYFNVLLYGREKLLEFKKILFKIIW